MQNILVDEFVQLVMGQLNSDFVNRRFMKNNFILIIVLTLCRNCVCILAIFNFLNPTFWRWLVVTILFMFLFV